MNKKVLFLPLYDADWASSKLRVYKHIAYLQQHGLECTLLRPPMPQLIPRIRYYWNMFKQCLFTDVIFIQKKIFRPLLFKLILATGKKVVFDFCDAIYLFEQDRDIVNYILSHVDLVLAADEPLAAYARQYGKSVQVFPTPLEMSPVKPCDPAAGDRIRIGWIGRPGNQHYLADLADVFAKLKDAGVNAELHVVSGEPFHFEGTDFPVVNIPWSDEAEEKALEDLDMGIVPLRDDEWSRGKCGYKALLFMSHGLAVIASPVGAKASIIQNGVNGILAASPEEWIASIRLLSQDGPLRCKLGQAGHETFAGQFTYDILSARLAAMLKSI